MEIFAWIFAVGYYIIVVAMIIAFLYMVWRSFQPVYYDTLRQPHRTQEAADEATRKADYGDE